MRPDGGEEFYCFDVAGDDDIVRLKANELAEKCYPRHEIYIDPRYLFGLLTRLYNWSNASIGSQYFCSRKPDTFDRNIFYLSSECTSKGFSPRMISEDPDGQKRPGDVIGAAVIDRRIGTGEIRMSAIQQGRRR